MSRNSSKSKLILNTRGYIHHVIIVAKVEYRTFSSRNKKMMQDNVTFNLQKLNGAVCKFQFA